MRTRAGVAATGAVLAALLLAGCGDAAGPVEGTRAERAVPASDLVRTGTVADLPGRPIQIGLAADGGIHVDTGLVDLDGLEAFLVEHARGSGNVEADGSSARNVLLRVHPALPWEIVQWTMMSCAHPSVKAYRIHFAVLPESGGPEGCIPSHLPRDRSTPHPVTVVAADADLRVSLFPHDESVAPEVLFAALREDVEKRAGLRPWATIRVPAPGRVASGHVLHLVDLLLRAGASDVLFEGTRLPAAEVRVPGSDGRTWVQRYVAEHPLPHPGCSVRVGAVRLDPSRYVAAPPLPAPPPRFRLRPDPALLDVEETEEVHATDVVAKEPTFREVPESPEEEQPVAPALPDGPARNVFIGSDGNIGGAFRGREALKDRLGAERRTKQEDAVSRALAWLAAHQSEDGGWEAAGFQAWCDGKANEGERPDGSGKAAYDVGTTGLALCAFLGAGYTNRGEHAYARVVRKGLTYLKNAQDPEDLFGARFDQHYIYNHAHATLAMVEVYGMTGSPIFKGSAQRALSFLALARNPFGGWRYGIKPGETDTSATAAMSMAFHSAQLVNADAVKQGKPVPFELDADTADDVRAWLDRVTDPTTGRAGYLTRGMGSARAQEHVDRFPSERTEAMTAAGLLLRLFLGEDPRTSPVIRAGTDACLALPPSWSVRDGSIDFTYWYYGTLALFQVGGEAWSAWERALERAVVAQQRTDGTPCSFKGSWDPLLDPWGEDGGRVYATAVLCLTMEVVYRYDRVFGVR